MTERFTPKEDHLLPSREIAYHYTVAMHFGQQLELNPHEAPQVKRPPQPN